MTAIRCKFLLFLAVLLPTAAMLAQQPLPAPLQGGSPSNVPWLYRCSAGACSTATSMH